LSLSNVAALICGHSTVLGSPEGTCRALRALHQTASEELWFRVTPV